MRAIFGDDLIGEHTTELLFDRLAGRRAFHRCLELVHEGVEELVDVHLLEDVCSVAVVVFDGVAERFRVVRLLLTHFERGEHAL